MEMHLSIDLYPIISTPATNTNTFLATTVITPITRSAIVEYTSNQNCLHVCLVRSKRKQSLDPVRIRSGWSIPWTVVVVRKLGKPSTLSVVVLFHLVRRFICHTDKNEHIRNTSNDGFKLPPPSSWDWQTSKTGGAGNRSWEWLLRARILMVWVRLIVTRGYACVCVCAYVCKYVKVVPKLEVLGEWGVRALTGFFVELAVCDGSTYLLSLAALLSPATESGSAGGNKLPNAGTESPSAML